MGIQQGHSGSPVPDFHELIYMISNGGVLTCVDAGKGKMVYRKRLEGRGQCVASPLIAGNHLILASEDGLISTVGTGDEFRLANSSWARAFR